jgi:RNA polymerase sigma factor (sigma-70 family)
MGAIPDRELIERHLQGDRQALAVIYDRYGAALYDVARSMTRHEADAADLVQDTFVIAATRVGQLRDRDRLKAWLFSVLRHEVYRRSRRRQREQPLEEMDMVMVGGDGRAPGSGGSGSDPTVDAVLDGTDRTDELAALVRDAGAGLDERDRLALELSVRQGLDGADLAAALGVSVAQSYSIVFRMRQRVERSMGALVVARGGRRDCPTLAQVLAGWDGSFDRLVRKRVSRHLDRCDTCQLTRRRLDPLLLVRRAPAFALPIGLRTRVLDAVGGGVPLDPDPLEPDPPGVGGGGGGSREVGDGLGRVDGAGFPVVRDHGRRRAVGAAIVAILVVVGLVMVGLVMVVRARADEATTATVASGAGAAVPGTSTAPGPSSPVAGGPGGPGLAVATTTPGSPAGGGGPGGVDVAPDPDPPGDPDDPAGGGDDGDGADGVVTGGLTVTPRSLDLSLTTATATIQVTNRGPEAVVLTVVPRGPVTVGPAGALAPGASVAFPVTFNGAGLGEGDHDGSVTVAAADTTVTVAVDGHVDRNPVVRAAEAPVVLVRSGGPVCGPLSWIVHTSVGDESAVSSVVLSWTAPAATDSVAMTPTGDGRTWQASLGPFPVPGSFSYAITATDARGNVTTIERALLVRTC